MKIICISILFLLLGLKVNATPVDSMFYGAFGKVTVYQPAHVPDAVVLFVSGDGGWNKGVVDMAKNIAAQGALVAGIDILHYLKSIKSLKSDCYYPAGDFEDLSLIIQKKYKLNQYLKPILVGYSSGATLVYGILVQAPSNTFKGAISLGFCPDIEIDKPLCNGSGLTTHALKEGKAFYLEAAKHLTAPFIVLVGMIDQVCSYGDTKKFMEGIPLAELISLPNVGHGFSITKNWLPQFISSYKKVLKEPGYVEAITAQNKLLQSKHLAPLSSNLPLTLIPSSAKENLPLVFFISGDGGWAGFEKAVCEKLAENGMPVVGLDAQKYFWKEKQPKEASDDITKAVEYYMLQWNKNSFILIGYSFGACVVPSIASNFSDSIKETLKGVFCFSPSETGDFEIHISDMMSLKTNEMYNVLSELKKIKTLNPVCIFGNEEAIELRNHFSVTGIRVETLPGSHHYGNNYKMVAAINERL
ncbi:MAG: virulence factor [Porphyromonadaceae bacterium]|nr:MAG: virulence factor [Porphyromonadaceae bacterium]